MSLTVVFPLLDKLLHPGSAGEQISALGVEVGIFTLILVALQVLIAVFEVLMVRNQGEILQRQEAESRRRAKLLLSGNYDVPNGVDLTGGYMRLYVMNVGDRAARGLTLQLALPMDLEPNEQQSAAWYGAGSEMIAEAKYMVYSRDYLERVFFPKTPNGLFNGFLLARTSVSQARLPAIQWRLLYEDGSTPAAGSWLRLALWYQDENGRVDPSTAT